MKKLLLICTLAFIGFSSYGQSYAFGVKGGLSVGFQQWGNSFQRDPLYRYHGIAFIESAPEDNQFALFAQGGYHVKGSAIRTFATVVQVPTGGFREVPPQEIPFEFHNLSLTLGAKQKYDLSGVYGYWLFGIRGDYTIDTQLRPDNLEEGNPYAIIYPFDEFVENFMFGVTLGGGFEFPLTEFISGLFEITVNPDFTNQYNQPEIRNVINPNPNSSQRTINISERQIRNTTIEVTLGFRFLHKIEYID